MSKLEKLVRRADRRRRFALALRGWKLVKGPWWRDSMFNELVLLRARDNGYRCIHCASEDIVGCVGHMWGDTVAWMCREHLDAAPPFTEVTPEMMRRSLPPGLLADFALDEKEVPR